MFAAWIWQWKNDHPAIVDIVWSYLTAGLAVGWILLEVEASWTRKILVALPIVVLYEFGIILSKLGTRIRNRADRLVNI